MKLLVWVVTTQRAQYNLTSIVDIRDVKATVVNVCSKTSLDSYSNGEQETNYAVVLSNSELGRIFGDGAIRKPSRSSTLVYVLRQAVWYKYSYGGTTDQYVQLSLIPDRNLLIYIVNFEFVPIESLVFFEVQGSAPWHTDSWGSKFVLTRSPEGIGTSSSRPSLTWFCILWLVF